MKQYCMCPLTATQLVYSENSDLTVLIPIKTLTLQDPFGGFVMYTVQ